MSDGIDFNNGIKSCNLVDGGSKGTPCWTIKDFSESKGVNYKTMLGWVKASNLKPVFTNKRTRYYSLSGLNEWFASR